MRWAQRCVAGLTATLVAAAVVLGAGAAGAAGKPSGPAFKKNDPCSWLGFPQVQRVFGGPITTSRNTGLAVACDFIVGTPPLTVGALRLTLIFPFFSQAGETGIDALEINRAIDAANSVSITGIKLGKLAYVNLDDSMVTVAVSKKFTIALQWTPAGAVPGAGEKMTPPLQKQLVTLAKAIISRTPSNLR
jgi:hypothetical protein